MLGESFDEVELMGEIEHLSFKDKYTTLSKSLNDSKNAEGKVQLSEDAYAIGQLLEALINKLNR